MAVHICSNDFDTGSIYDGEWQLNQRISGYYTLSYLNFASIYIPWMWDGFNGIRIRYVPDSEAIGGDVTGTYEFSSTLMNMTDKDDIAAQIMTELNADANVKLGTNTYGNAFTAASYDSVEDRFSFTVNPSWDGVQIFWAHVDCTSRYVFNKTVDQPILLSSIGLSATYISIFPKFLECMIEQSSSYYINSSTSFPTLLITTNDIPYLDQQIDIPAATNTLNISFYRTNIPVAPVPLTGEWDMIFRPRR